MRTLFTLIAIVWLATAALAGENFTGDSDVVSKAEASRSALWRYWFGGKMRTWAKPCPITVRKASGASGATNFVFDRGEVFGWRMQVGGPTRSSVIATAIPHEVNHTIFATKFRRPLPRWLDEGAAIFVESESEHLRARTGLNDNIKASKFTKFRDLFRNSGSYPRDGVRVANVYNEGFAIVEFLVNHHRGGKETFVKFVGDVQVDVSGASTLAALRRHYGYKSADDLESKWWDHWRARGGLRCSHHACKAPHGGVFDPTLSITNGRGLGFGVRSPVVGFVPAGRPAPECRVVMYSGKFCGPCVKWKGSELGKVQAAGITVEIRDDRPESELKSRSISSLPTFLIVHKNVERGRTTGFQTAKTIIDLFHRCKPKPAPRLNAGWETIPTRPSTTVVRVDHSKEIAALSESLRNLAVRIETIEGKPEPKPVDLTSVKTTLATLAAQLTKIESKPGVDLGPITRRLTAVENKPAPKPADLSGVERRLSTLEGLVIPVRIETADGKLIREKRYSLTRDEDGRLIFKPIVLKFDERILTGEK